MPRHSAPSPARTTRPSATPGRTPTNWVGRGRGGGAATIVAALLLGATLYAGARPVGPAPALGAFLEPARGVWALARTGSLRGDHSAAVPTLGAEVRVVYDRRAVPHIFASSEDDAYR